MPSSLTTRASLLGRLRDASDVAAWQTFTDTYAPLIYGFCRRHGLQEADAADVGQEVLAQIMQSIKTFEYSPEKGKFRNWLGVVVRGKLARFHQTQARGLAPGGRAEAGALDTVEAPSEDSEWSAAFNTRVLHVALERIRPDYQTHTWQAFEKVWLETRPVEEVAQALGMAKTAVYMAKSRILQRLREEIVHLAEDAAHLVPLG